MNIKIEPKRKMRILIIDDSKYIRDSLQSLLFEYNEKIITKEAKTMLEGNELIKEFKPDIIILDVKLPDGTGFEILKNRDFEKVRSENSGFPVIIVFTNYPFVQYRERAFKEGADYFYDKSSELENLSQTLDKYIKYYEEKFFEKSLAIL